MDIQRSVLEVSKPKSDCQH